MIVFGIIIVVLIGLFYERYKFLKENNFFLKYIKIQKVKRKIKFQKIKVKFFNFISYILKTKK